MAFSVKITPCSSPVCNTLNSNDWRSDVILWMPLMNSERTILSASIKWCGVPGLRVVMLSRTVASGSWFDFFSVKCSIGGKIGNSSPCAGDDDVKKFGKLVSTNSLVTKDEFKFDVGSIGIADDKTDDVTHSKRTYKRCIYI